eukprot:scaffold7960_cov129-Isochrysis_galbana.AAC.6
MAHLLARETISVLLVVRGGHRVRMHQRCRRAPAERARTLGGQAVRGPQGLLAGSLYFDPRRAQQSLTSLLNALLALLGGATGLARFLPRRALANRAGTWPEQDKERSKRT